MIKDELLESIEVKDIKDVDFNKSYFHYTDIHNFESILEKGLLPKVGANSIGVETTEKIFFTIGFEQTLVLMDVWLRWLIGKSAIDLPGKSLDTIFYRFCIWLIQWPIKPNFIINGIVKNSLKNPKRRRKLYATMKGILDNAIFFELKLEENVDFSFEDVDEVKIKNFDRKLLKMLYNCECKKDDVKMEAWNMHTFTGKTIPKNKLIILKCDSSFKASDIIRFMVSKTEYNEELIFFNEYLEYCNEINSKYS